MILGLLSIFLIGGNIAFGKSLLFYHNFSRISFILFIIFLDPLHHPIVVVNFYNNPELEVLDYYHVSPEDINIRENEHTPTEKLLWINANVWVEAWVDDRLNHHTYFVRTTFVNYIPARNVIDGFRGNTHRGWNIAIGMYIYCI